jgi:hypothetical protein
VSQSLVHNINLIPTMKRESLDQYTWLMKVLDSCENTAQIETSERLFELYMKKWKNDISEKNVILLSNNFEKEKKGQLSKVTRKNKSFFSKMSQFFLF